MTQWLGPEFNTSRVDGELREQVRLGLSHLDDAQYLARNTRLGQMRSLLGVTSTRDGKAVQALLVRAMEGLHPGPGASHDDERLLRYRIFQRRYIDRVVPSEISSEFSIRHDYYNSLYNSGLDWLTLQLQSGNAVNQGVVPRRRETARRGMAVPSLAALTLPGWLRRPRLPDNLDFASARRAFGMAALILFVGMLGYSAWFVMRTAGPFASRAAPTQTAGSSAAPSPLSPTASPTPRPAPSATPFGALGASSATATVTPEVTATLTETRETGTPTRTATPAPAATATALAASASPAPTTTPSPSPTVRTESATATATATSAPSTAATAASTATAAPSTAATAASTATAAPPTATAVPPAAATATATAVVPTMTATVAAFASATPGTPPTPTASATAAVPGAASSSTPAAPTATVPPRTATPVPSPTAVPAPPPVSGTVSVAVTPNSTSVGSEIWVEVRASNPALNTIRVLLGCGTPNLFENAAAEASFIWRTAGCPAGSHTITAEARPGYDANWSRAVSGGTTITLTPP